MKIKSVLKPKQVAWVSGGLLVGHPGHRRLSLRGEAFHTGAIVARG